MTRTKALMKRWTLSRSWDLKRVQLTARGFCSTEPGFGDARRAFVRAQPGCGGCMVRLGFPVGLHERSNAGESESLIFVGARGLLDEGSELALQPVHPRVRMGPHVGQGLGVESPEERLHLWTLQEERPGGYEQSDRVLDGVDGIDEIFVLDEVEELEEVGPCGPRGERQERRPHGDAGNT